jgi:hypothetical protein
MLHKYKRPFFHFLYSIPDPRRRCRLQSGEAVGRVGTAPRDH